MLTKLRNLSILKSLFTSSKASNGRIEGISTKTLPSSRNSSHFVLLSSFSTLVFVSSSEWSSSSFPICGFSSSIYYRARATSKSKQPPPTPVPRRPTLSSIDESFFRVSDCSYSVPSFVESGLLRPAKPDEKTIKMIEEVIPLDNWVLSVNNNVVTIKRNENVMIVKAQAPVPWKLISDLKEGNTTAEKVPVEITLVFFEKLGVDEYAKLDRCVQTAADELNEKVADIPRDPFRTISRLNEWEYRDENDKEMISLVWKHKNSVEVILSEQHGELGPYSVAYIPDSPFREAFFPEEADVEIWKLRADLCSLIAMIPMKNRKIYLISNREEVKKITSFREFEKKMVDQMQQELKERQLQKDSQQGSSSLQNQQEPTQEFSGQHQQGQSSSQQQ